MNLLEFISILLYNMNDYFSRQFVYIREGDIMAEIRVGENESLDNALKRFKRQCARAGVLSEYRKREHYEKPSVKRKKKSEAARRKKKNSKLFKI